MKKNELQYKDLKNICNPDIFDFETTSEVDNLESVYGQDRRNKCNRIWIKYQYQRL